MQRQQKRSQSKWFKQIKAAAAQVAPMRVEADLAQN
jgi:hypothetical protein